MNEKVKIMSLSLPPSTQERLKEAAKKMRISVSSLVKILVDRHLSLVTSDSEDISVILTIPKSLRGDPVGLKKWLDIKTAAIVSKLGK